MNARTLILMTTLTLVPAGLAAQAADAAASAAGNAAVQAPDARIEAAMEAAAEAQIPASLLESKVREGEAKNVPMDRVAAAVEARLEALLRARDLLQRADVQAASEGELLVTSEALRAGVSESTLIQVTRDAPEDRRAVATAVLTDLVRLGYESAPASARVSAALSAGPDALINLRAEATASLRARGLPITDLSGSATGGLNF